MPYQGKKIICETDPCDFTDIQGMNGVPLYHRYIPIQRIVNSIIPNGYKHFLAAPEEHGDSGCIVWYIDDWTDTPIALNKLEPEEKLRYEQILGRTIKKWKEAIDNRPDQDKSILKMATKYIDPECVYCSDDKVYLVAWGMTVDRNKYQATGAAIQEMDYIQLHKVTFECGEHATFKSKLDKTLYCHHNKTIEASSIPVPKLEKGFEANGWKPNPDNYVIKEDTTFYLQVKEAKAPEPKPEPEPKPKPKPKPPKTIHARFDPGEHGTIEGQADVELTEGDTISSNRIPKVIPEKYYRFTSWKPNPEGMKLERSQTFTAQYTEHLPWYKRFWIWLTGLWAGLFSGKGCLRKLLYLLLGLLLLFLVLCLIRSCGGCSRNDAETVDTIDTPNGPVDNNGFVVPITDETGSLPEQGNIVAPVLGDDGQPFPIEQNPGCPDVVANRLILFMANANDDIDALARAFKREYPGEKYSIIGFDREVPMLIVQVPAEERNQIREGLNSRIPEHEFLVFDEQIYQLNQSQDATNGNLAGWHLNAINLPQAWNITKGDSNVIVAVVDDGLDIKHPMFKRGLFGSCIVRPYNVFRQDSKLSMGNGHGTSVAALAVGTDRLYNSKHVSGVAPNCLLMPVQIYDNGHTTFSALVAGVLYAVHHGAKVINVSSGPSFKGLNAMPIEDQEMIATTYFMNETRLWGRVSQIATQQNSIIVFAAGNDNIITAIPPENRLINTLAVTAVDNNLCQAKFTNYGHFSDISAPGAEIYSATPNNGYKFMDGTSFSAPIVSGVIALMKTICPTITPQQARCAMLQTGKAVSGNVPPMVLADQALLAVQNGDTVCQNTTWQSPNGPIIGSDPSDTYRTIIGPPVGNDTTGVIVDPAYGSDPSVNYQPPVNRGDLHSPGSGRDQQATPTQPTPQSPENDYEAIRKLIESYKKKISDLERLLPENQ